MGSHQSGVEGQNDLSWPVGHTVFDAAEDTAGLLGHQPFIHQPRGSLSCSTQHLASLNLIKFTWSHLEPVQVPLEGISSLRHVSCTTQLTVFCKHVESAYNPAVYFLLHWQAVAT